MLIFLFSAYIAFIIVGVAHSEISERRACTMKKLGIRYQTNLERLLIK